MSNYIPYKEKKLVETILSYYAEKEKKASGPKMYFTNTEFDSNVSVFEGLSNANRLGLISKLPLKSAKVVLAILQAILSENFWIFDAEEFLQEDDFLEELFPEEESLDTLIEKLKKYKNLKMWIKVLESQLPEEIHVSDSLPEVNTDYDIKGFGKFKQKYFRISEINFNLRMTKKGIVEIAK